MAARGPRSRRRVAWVAVLAALLLAAGGVLVLLTGGEEQTDQSDGAPEPTQVPGVIANDAPPQASGINVDEGDEFAVESGTVAQGWKVAGDPLTTTIENISLRNTTEREQYGLLVFRVFAEGGFAGDITCFSEVALQAGDTGPLSCAGGLKRPQRISEIRVRDSLAGTQP